MQNRTRAAWLAALLLALGAPTAAARGLVKVSAAFDPAEAAPGTTVDLVVTAEVEPGYHMYAPDSPSEAGIPTSIEVSATGGLVEAGDLTFSKPKSKFDDIFEVVVRIHEGEVEFRRPYRVPDGASGTITLNGVVDLQVCDENSCTREEPEFTATLAIGGAAGGDTAPASDGTGADAIPEPELGFDLIAMSAGFEPATARAGEVVTLKLIFAIADGRHLYAPDSPAGLPTDVAIEGVEGLEPRGELEFPEPEVHYSDVFEADEHLYADRVVFTREFVVAAGTSPGEIVLTGEVSGQTCDDQGCVRFEMPLRAALAVEAGPPRVAAPVAALAGTEDEPKAGEDATAKTEAVDAEVESGDAGSIGGGQDVHSMGLGAFLALAVFWGFVTLLMPCTYPMIPITISFFTKQAIQREGKVLPLSLTYGAGIVAIFVLIGVVLGAPIIRFAQSPWTNLVIGVLFLFFALVLFGAIELRPAGWMLALAGRAAKEGGLLGVFLMGATLVVTSFTCTAPFVGSLLSVGAGGGDLGRIALGMGVFGLTMAVPFVMLSLLPGKMQRMPQAGDWMHVLKVFLGFVEVAAALKFFSNSDLVWEWGILSREVFLVLWVGIFLAGAAFLFGWIRLKGEADEGIGPVRMLGGLGSLLLSLYLSLGVFGFVLDDITTAIIPNYSSERLWKGGGAAEKGHTILKDDLEGAKAAALAQDKLLLLNFTGFS